MTEGEMLTEEDPITYRVDIGFSALGNPGAAAWAASITLPDGIMREVSESREMETNAAISARAILGTLRALPAGAEGVVYSRDENGIKTVTTWLPAWEANGWRKKDKKPVANVDTWRMIAGELKLRPGLVFEWAGKTPSDLTARMEAEATRLAKIVEARKQY